MTTAEHSTDRPEHRPVAPPTSQPPNAFPEPTMPEAASPAGLLTRAKASRFAPFGPAESAPNRHAASLARSAVLAMAERMDDGQLTVREPDGRTHRFGVDIDRDIDLDTDIGGAPGPGAGGPVGPADRVAPSASMEVLDQRAWLALVSEGSIGLGRGYIEGWWDSDDPTGVVRILIRNLAGLDELRNRVHRITGRVGDVVRRALPRPDRARNREDIGAHYDLSNDFFRLFLDPSMTYSSAVFEDPGAGLEAASQAKYDRLLTKLGIRPGQRLLEIGTGWGGLALRAAEHHGAKVTTTTVSGRQLAEAKARAATSAAAERINVLGRDWRDLSGVYQRVVSIEMIEAVDWRDYDRFFATIERCLTPDGMVGLQAICVPDRRWSRTKNTEDFIRRFVFPGGLLPSIGTVVSAVARSTRLQVLDVEDFTAHYAETLRRWRARFDAAGPEIAELGLDERFRRLWRFYLAYCEAGFLERHCTVNQLVLVGPDWRPDGLALRPR